MGELNVLRPSDALVTISASTGDGFDVRVSGVPESAYPDRTAGDYLGALRHAAVLASSIGCNVLDTTDRGKGSARSRVVARRLRGGLEPIDPAVLELIHKHGRVSVYADGSAFTVALSWCGPFEINSNKWAWIGPFDDEHDASRAADKIAAEYRIAR